MKSMDVWSQRKLAYKVSDRVAALHKSLINRAVSDRSGEWFVQEELDAKYAVAERYKDESVIIRRARAIEAMLHALTDEELTESDVSPARLEQLSSGVAADKPLTSVIFKEDLLLGTLPMGSNGLGKVFPGYLKSEEKRAGAITNRSSLSLFGHNTINYQELVTEGLEAVLMKCDREIQAQKEEIVLCESLIVSCEEQINGLTDREEIEIQSYVLEKHKRKRDRRGNQQDFYESVKISCQAVIDFAERWAVLAQKAAVEEVDSQRKQELLDMADIASRVPRQPASTFREAVQSIWFYHLALHAGMNFISLGRLDQVLNPFLQKEKDYGACLEIFECFMLKAAWRLNLNLSPGNIAKQDHVDNATVLGVNPYLIDQKAGVNNFLQNIIIGGVTPEGEDAANDCTFLILKAFSHVNLSTPGLYIRVGDMSKEDLRVAIADTWSITKNNPSILNDETMIPAMYNTLKQGSDATKKHIYNVLKDDFSELPPGQQKDIKRILKGMSADQKEAALDLYYQDTIKKLANDYCVDGCWEPILNGSSDWTFGMLCALTPLECALNEGAMLSSDPELLRGQKLAPRTQRPRSFEELMEAFSAQMDFFVDQRITSLFLYYMMDEFACPSPLLSAYLDGCMLYGRDKSWAGASYNIGGVIMSAVPNVVNTLAAIQKFVRFDKDMVESSIRQYSLDDVIEALKGDFICGDPLDLEKQDRFDSIKIDFRTNSPKFGNNDPVTNELCQRVLNCYAESVERAAQFAKETFQDEPKREAFRSEEEFYKRKKELYARRSIAGYYGDSLEKRFGSFNMMISAGLGTFEQYNWSGKGNSASADRLRGEPLAPNFSPVPGTVYNGLAGINATLSQMNLERFAGGVITDMCLSDGQEYSVQDLASILNGFISDRGAMMTFTIGDRDLYTQIYQEVVSAQKINDESVTESLLKKYADINVRIGGWQTPFVTLPFSHMENYIQRPVLAEEPVV